MRLALLLALLPFAAQAEVTKIAAAQQYGVSFLPLMVMQHDHLAEHHAEAAGLPKLDVTWVSVAGPSVMNDGLLSGTIQFAALGAPSLITLWDRTAHNVGIKGVSAITTYPLYLVSRDPAVKSVKDFTSNDKIAVPSIKISTQAIMLQMAAASAFGSDNWTRLDPYTVSLSHPDGLAAITNETAGINSHFTSSPFYEREIKLPGAHLVTTNYDILGGPATALTLVASTRFRDANPGVFKAFRDGLAEAIDIINRDKPAAARLYIEMSGDRFTSEADLVQIISDKDYAFTLTPQKVLATAQFMAKIGSIKQTPAAVTDMFFPEAAPNGGD